MRHNQIYLVIVCLFVGILSLTPVVQAGGGGNGNTTPVNIGGGQWLAIYYPNENLSGTPTAIQTEQFIGGNWQFGTPIPSLPADHWSARWTQTFALSPGVYRISIQADDGARVYLNGSIIMNEWHGHSPETYTVEFTTSNQQDTISVEYFDGVQQAYLTFDLARLTGSNSIPVGATATILQNNTSGFFESNTNSGVRYLLPSNVTYDVINMTSDRQWLQLNVNGVGVWVISSFVRVNGSVNPQQPIVYPTAIVYPTSVPVPTQIPYNPPSNGSAQGYPLATVTAPVLNVRAIPDAGSQVITQIRYGETYTARRGNINGWIQLIINGQIGWVNSGFVSLNTRTNLVNLAGNASVTVTAARLNVRNRPNIYGGVITKINRTEHHAIVGRNARNSWILIDVNGTFGWVSRGEVSIQNGFDLPIVDDVPPVIPPAREYILATATPYRVNMRQGPAQYFADVGNFERGDSAKVIGRTVDNRWWQIEYNGMQGWVAAAFAHIQENADISAIPIRNS